MKAGSDLAGRIKIDFKGNEINMFCLSRMRSRLLLYFHLYFFKHNAVSDILQSRQKKEPIVKTGEPLVPQLSSNFRSIAF